MRKNQYLQCERNISHKMLLSSFVDPLKMPQYIKYPDTNKIIPVYFVAMGR